MYIHHSITTTCYRTLIRMCIHFADNTRFTRVCAHSAHKRPAAPTIIRKRIQLFFSFRFSGLAPLPQMYTHTKERYRQTNIEPHIILAGGSFSGRMANILVGYYTVTRPVDLCQTEKRNSVRLYTQALVRYCIAYSIHFYCTCVFDVSGSIVRRYGRRSCRVLIALETNNDAVVLRFLRLMRAQGIPKRYTSCGYGEGVGGGCRERAPITHSNSSNRTTSFPIRHTC